MGLLYVFPVATDEKDFVDIQVDKITLKTYGLPYIFWGYALGICLVILFMFLAIKAPILKLIQLGDEADALLGYALFSFLALLPTTLLSFFFFEKRIIKTKNEFILEYRTFGLKFFSEKFIPHSENPLEVSAFLSSPNMARTKGHEESAGFQNKGYFILWLKTKDGKRINIDRHSRKADLIKLESLLNAHP
jgi:hypothetical protein